MRRLIVLVALAISQAAMGASVRQHLRGLSATASYRKAVDALVDAAARALPLPSSSAAYTYRWDAATGRYERTSEVLGPAPFLERPQTVGRRVWNVGITTQYLELDDFDGRPVGEDPLPQNFGSAGVQFTWTEPQIIYHLTAVNVTCGLTDDLDLNVVVPVATGDFDITQRHGFSPDRLIETASQRGHIPLGLADILVRAKYRLANWGEVTPAVGFVARLPTGSREDALGTGDGELGGYLAVSRPVWRWVEAYGNLGFDFNVDDLNLSSGRWALGASAQPLERLNLAVAFLGRHEVGDRVDAASIESPHQVGRTIVPAPELGLNFSRKDYVDFSAALRVQVYRTLVFTIGVLRRINTAGLRSSEWSPLAGLEASF